MKFIEGKKTYIVGVATLVFAVLGILLGYIEMDRAVELIALAFTGMGLRHGISTETRDVVESVLKLSRKK